MSEAIALFRSPQISRQSLTADPPIILEIIVSEGTPVGGAISDDVAGSAISFCETGVGDSPVILANKSVSTQITSTRPSPSIPRVSSAHAQAPPVRREVHYIHAPLMPGPPSADIEDQHFEQYDSSEEDESEYPPGYYDDSDSCEEVEEEQDGHLAAPYFSSDRLEQDETLDTGFQGDSYGGVLEPHVGDEFLPQNDFSVGTVSYVRDAILENENLEHYEGYTAEEWAAWDAGAHDSYVSGGAQFDDESSYYEEESGYYSDDGYY
ncbi:hypothetical protein CYMTET_10711 [Cymbomonas tetramitiformis]|uniref:Transcription factor Iwr1 domain-containing protein n=1 Tax=Cymbomonas tetramitiformis TaxID=36881 RepID=A0AAE0GNW2_9CHLO|nr:hypothetical protein CYMTET_10711 [Cymbomonas tetramitiformis]